MGVARASIALDRERMRDALTLARRARDAGEVPVGAVVARGDAVIGRGHNQSIGANDPSAHAEIVAIRAAAAAVGNYRLDGATLYATLEPCAMCAGAIVHARIARVVFAAHDPNAGAAGGALNLLDAPFMNHRCAITAGVEATEAEALLHDFFAQRRE